MSLARMPVVPVDCLPAVPCGFLAEQDTHPLPRTFTRPCFTRLACHWVTDTLLLRRLGETVSCTKICCPSGAQKPVTLVETYYTEKPLPRSCSWFWSSALDLTPGSAGQCWRVTQPACSSRNRAGFWEITGDDCPFCTALWMPMERSGRFLKRKTKMQVLWFDFLIGIFVFMLFIMCSVFFYFAKHFVLSTKQWKTFLGHLPLHMLSLPTIDPERGHPHFLNLPWARKSKSWKPEGILVRGAWLLLIRWGAGNSFLYWVHRESPSTS